jgi:hypothetical protein
MPKLHDVLNEIVRALQVRQEHKDELHASIAALETGEGKAVIAAESSEDTRPLNTEAAPPA